MSRSNKFGNYSSVKKKYENILETYEHKIDSTLKKYHATSINDAKIPPILRNFWLPKWNEEAIKADEVLSKVKFKDDKQLRSLEYAPKQERWYSKDIEEQFIKIKNKDNTAEYDEDVDKDEMEQFENLMKKMEQIDVELKGQPNFNAIDYKYLSYGSDKLEESITAYVEEHIGSVELFKFATDIYFNWKGGNVQEAFNKYKKDVSKIKKETDYNNKLYKDALERYKKGESETISWKRMFKKVVKEE